MAKAHPWRRRATIALLVSTFLHVAVAAIVWLLLPAPTPVKRAPLPLVEFVVVAPRPQQSPAAPEAEVAPATTPAYVPQPPAAMATPSAPPAPEPLSPSPSPVTEAPMASAEESGASGGAASGGDRGATEAPLAGGPRRLDSLLPHAVAPSGPEDDAASRVKALVDIPWQQRAAETRARRDLDIGRGELAEVEQRMEDWFFPEAAPLVARAGVRQQGSGPAADPSKPETLALPRPHGTDLDEVIGMLNGTPPPPAPLNPAVAAKLADSKFPIYLGTPDTAALLAELAALVQVEHAEDGEPASWTLWESSGNRRFDEAALAAVKSCVADGAAVKTPLDPKPRWSRWRFSAELYRFARDFDPTFIPPGVPVDGGALGPVRLIREARLVAVGFDTEASGSSHATEPPQSSEVDGDGRALEPPGVAR